MADLTRRDVLFILIWKKNLAGADLRGLALSGLDLS